MVESSLDFSGRGRKLQQKKIPSMVEGSLDFSGRGRKSNGKKSPSMLDSSLDFVALGRKQTQGIASMVEKGTGVPMVESITTTRTGRGKKKKVVSVKKFAKAEAKTGAKTLGETNIDVKGIIEGIKKFNKAGEGLGKKIGGKGKVKAATKSEEALDRILEKSQVKPQDPNLELSADQLTQRRIRTLIDEEKAKKKGLLSRFRRRS